MKKGLRLIFLSILFTAISNGLFSQEKPNEIYAGWSPGILGYQVFYEISLDLVEDIFSALGASSTTEKTGGTGIIYLGYGRFVNAWLKVGLNGSYVSYTNTKEYIKNGETVKSVKWRDAFMSGMIRADFHYVKKENVSMYSGLAAGVSFTSSKTLSGETNFELDNNTLFAFHINAFGIRFGKSLGFFFEAGFGYNGMLNAGVNYRL